MEHSKSSLEREVYSDTSLPQGIRKISNKQPTFHLKELEKEERKKPKASRKTEQINKVERNEIDTKRTIEKISETKRWFLKR